tara:strand:- start:431 stop:658 length:228 start_codon:yes stop_codon:yes gene_type:complete
MQIEEIFSEVFNVEKSNINESLNIRDIKTWDSMNHMTLIEALESNYNVMLTGDQIAEIETVRDVIESLRKQGANL